MEHEKNQGGSPYPDYIDGEEERRKLLWSRIRYFLREPFSEFFGVMVMIMFGDGSVAQVVLSNGQKGQYQSITWGWGLDTQLLPCLILLLILVLVHAYLYS